jgi:hypothetical protein
MSKKLISLIAAVFIITGCASGVTRSPAAQESHFVVSLDNQVASVSLSLTENAKQKAAENLKFNADELLNHMKRALDANSLVNGATDKPRPNLEVQVKDMRVRSNFSAIMFGFMAGADSITGDIVIKDPDGKELDRYEVDVSYALGGIGGGQDGARMGWLYEKFAEEAVKELTKKQ